MSNASDFVIENDVLKEYKGPGGDVVIPAEVEAIHREVFRFCETIQVVYLPDCIKTIGMRAFTGSKITRINIPDNTEIDFEAFRGCSALQEIRLPANLDVIGDGAFAGCKSLTSVIFPQTIETIGAGAFDGCSSLREIMLPQSLIHLEGGAFSGCSSLREVALPSAVETIGQQCFDQCSNLEKIVLPNGLKAIGGGAFARCGNLKYVDCSDEVFRLFLDSFNAKDRLSKIYKYLTHELVTTATPDERFTKYVKRNKAKLFELILAEDNVTAIGELSNIDGILNQKTIDFMLESAISKQNVPAVTAWLLQFKTQYFPTIDAETEWNNLEIDYKKLYVVKNIDEKHVCLGKYSGTDVVVSVPETIKNKEVNTLDSTFNGYTQLQAVELPKTVEVIGRSAFEGCTGLHCITLPEKLKKIGSAAFRNCVALTEIELPKTVSLIGCSVFENCISLQKVTLSVKIKKIPMNTFNNCTALTEITLPPRCREIEFFAFTNCPNLQAIHISAELKAIDYDAFCNCPNLTINAPADSYAETYAKEHDIPFVAE